MLWFHKNYSDNRSSIMHTLYNALFVLQPKFPNCIKWHCIHTDIQIYTHNSKCIHTDTQTHRHTHTHKILPQIQKFWHKHCQYYSLDLLSPVVLEETQCVPSLVIYSTKIKFKHTDTHTDTQTHISYEVSKFYKVL